MIRTNVTEPVFAQQGPTYRSLDSIECHEITNGLSTEICAGGLPLNKSSGSLVHMAAKRCATITAIETTPLNIPARIHVVKGILHMGHSTRNVIFFCPRLI